MENELTVIFHHQPVVGTSVKYTCDGKEKDSAPITSISQETHENTIFHIITVDGRMLAGSVKYSSQSSQTHYGLQCQSVLSGEVPQNTDVPEMIAKRLSRETSIFSHIWSVIHNIWFSILSFTPCINTFVCVLLSSRDDYFGFESIDEFRRFKNAWVFWIPIIIVAFFVLGQIVAIFSLVFHFIFRR